jgi:hypothetical protein
VVNKRACWRPLQLAWWYCDHSDWTFLHAYGDKGALEVGWAACGQDHTRYQREARWADHSYLHVGPDRGPLFVHRCRDKFRFGSAGYMTPADVRREPVQPHPPAGGGVLHLARGTGRPPGGGPGDGPTRRPDPSRVPARVPGAGRGVRGNAGPVA